MKLLINKHDKNSIEFTLHAPVEYANAIRRTIMSDLPTFALHNITIHENSSCLDNDMLEQRIVLIPIINGVETHFEYKITNETEENISVYSHNLSNSLVPNILVVTLKPEQKLHISASSKQGIGFGNAKWSCITDLKYKQHRELIGELTKEELLKVQTIIPQFKLKQITEFIDTNLIFMINQICEREVYSQKHHNIFTISFSTIDKSIPLDRLKQVLTQLIQRVLHINIKGNKIETNDYSVPNLLMLEHSDKNFTCIKKHNLDTYFEVSTLDHLETVQEKIAQQIRELNAQLV